jgi:hypothetical protein
LVIAGLFPATPLMDAAPEPINRLGAFSGKVESGFPSENAAMQKC